jgi:hypothetical protein
MPNRSKFSERRRQRILAVLAAGGSRRTAAKVAGIDPATLRGWLQRGERGAPGGRWATFYADVQAAEAGHRLVGLPDDDEDDVVAAMRYLDQSGGWDALTAAPEPEEPVVIELKWTKWPDDEKDEDEEEG